MLATVIRSLGRLKLTEGKETTQCQAEGEKKEANEELAALANRRKKRAARCGLPDLMQ